MDVVQVKRFLVHYHVLNSYLFRLQIKHTLEHCRMADADEANFDEFEHYNFDQEKAMNSGHSGKFRPET